MPVLESMSAESLGGLSSLRFLSRQQYQVPTSRRNVVQEQKRLYDYTCLTRFLVEL